ncbi:TetR family transcriptional regulator ActII [Pseudonocardia eucalypti]|uniref:TetR family transcriptional regulator ActII n=1 Tax=Pseudonocardia eucalypti TaxID=648755 RepID=A0ABP9PU50_9PSEU|nr:AcrR family transcriptional regulator [Pseudonocardia eucalypti]
MPSRQRATAERLTTDALVDAVAALIESGGVEALTMRRLAQECGVGVTTLYGHVRTKDELLGLFADRLLGRIRPPEESLPWDEQVGAIFRAVYEILVDHPELAQIVGRQPVPGSAALRLFQQVLRALVGIGLTDRQIRTGYAVLAAYTTGYVQHQAARTARTPALADLIADARHVDTHPEPNGDGADHLTAFDAGLRVILDGLSAAATRRG